MKTRLKKTQKFHPVCGIPVPAVHKQKIKHTQYTRTHRGLFAGFLAISGAAGEKTREEKAGTGPASCVAHFRHSFLGIQMQVITTGKTNSG